MTLSLSRNSIASLFAAGAILTPAAAELISHRYDGVYEGKTRVAREISEASCTALPLRRLEIRNGILRAFQPGGHQSVKGFVTADGFFTADYIFPDGRATPFEGIIDARGKLTGGVAAGGCAWVVELSR